MLDSDEVRGRPQGGLPQEAGGSTRRAFVGITVAGAAVSSAALLAAPALAGGRRSPAQDRTILNFALLLEYIQAALYREALRRRSIRGDLREFAEVVGEQEQQHVVLLEKALGSRARREPRLDLTAATRSSRKFLRSALVVEDTAVSAYNGQAANLTRAALAPALEIVSVEGRHAAWIRDIAGEDPAPFAADAGMSAVEVTNILKRNGLLKTR